MTKWSTLTDCACQEIASNTAPSVSVVCLEMENLHFLLIRTSLFFDQKLCVLSKFGDACQNSTMKILRENPYFETVATILSGILFSEYMIVATRTCVLVRTYRTLLVQLVRKAAPTNQTLTYTVEPN